MAIEDHTVDENEDLDIDPDLDHLFYSSGIDDCLIEEAEYRSSFSQIGDQGMWKDHNTNECIISFCGGSSRAWEEGGKEIEELKLNLLKMLDKTESNPISKLDIIKLFYVHDSETWRAFNDKLDWTYNKFLLFIVTCCRLSEFSLTTGHAYSAGLMDGMMEKNEFIKCFENIHTASSVKSQFTAAREKISLWKSCQNAFNSLSREITLIDRPYQVQVVDDDKEHFESVNRNVYENVTIKKVKHVRDNRYGHVVHTMATGAMQLATCVKYEENGETTNSIFDSMITNIAFGHNTAALPNLTGLMLGYDRGYVFRELLLR